MGISRSMLAMIALLTSSSHAALAAPTPTPTLSAVVDSFAQTSIDDGGAVGIAVAVLRGGELPRLFTYGYANRDGDAALPLTDRSRFQIASVTKVFTTNVLGQEVSDGTLSLQDTLGNFSAQLGVLQPEMAQATLLQLGDFTAGLPSTAPPCGKPRSPGCLPPDGRDMKYYDAKQFLDYFQHAVPMNENDNPPTPVESLPAPYFYSDFSIGLLGLLLHPLPGTQLTDTALQRWFRVVNARLLVPLGMHDTFLNPPTNRVPLALGYTLALTTPVVSGGQITSITLRNKGAGYTVAPQVSITGGGGKGATATATVSNGQVTGFTIGDAGSGYIARPTVTFTGTATTPATGRVVVKDGRVVAVEVTTTGAGYTSAPTVTITGGQKPGSTATAQAVAHIANGTVTWVEMTQPGAGYVPLISAVVTPGAGALNAIPIWGAAGSLSTDVYDLARFTAAALGRGLVGGQPVPATVAAGFRIAETAYACNGKDPSLATCPSAATRSALTWSIQPADLANRYPAIISKNGSLPGFTTQIYLAPARHLAVAVMMNTRETENTAGPGIIGADSKGITAFTIARNILNALLYQPNVE